MNGADEEVELGLLTSCVPCSGTGAEGGVLDTCGVLWSRRAVTHGANGAVPNKADRTCPSCDGRGKIPKTTCKACKGRGRKEQSTTLRFSIPAGAEDGTRLRLRGKGEPGRDGQASGDLLVELEVSPHPLRTKPERPHHVPASRLRGPCARHDRHARSSGRENARNPCPEGLHGWRHHRHSAPRLPTLEGWRSRRCGGAAQLHMPSKFPQQVRAALEELREDMAPKDLEARIRDEAETRRRGG